MRKRVLSILLLLSLLFALALPASGVSDLAFAAVNDTVPMTLSGDSLPFYSGGVLYVPYTVFSISALGIFPSYNADSGSLTLFRKNERLAFDLEAGTVTDERGSVQTATVITSGGVLFLPAELCANHFGIQVSDLTSKGGYTVVRFTTGSQVYDDSLFIEKAENLLSYRVAQFNGVAEPVPGTPSSQPSSSVTPSQPAPATPSAPTVEPEDPEELEPPTICLALTGADGAREALDLLDEGDLPAAFFLTASEIAADGDLVRQIAAGGYSIGLAVSDGEDPAEALRKANEALDGALRTKSLLALLPAEADASAVGNAYCVFQRPAVQLTAAEAAEAHGETRLLLCDAASLSAALFTLRPASPAFARLCETTQLS